MDKDPAVRSGPPQPLAVLQGLRVGELFFKSPADSLHNIYDEPDYCPHEEQPNYPARHHQQPGAIINQYTNSSTYGVNQAQ